MGLPIEFLLNPAPSQHEACGGMLQPAIVDIQEHLPSQIRRAPLPVRDHFAAQAIFPPAIQLAASSTATHTESIASNSATLPAADAQSVDGSAAEDLDAQKSLEPGVVGSSPVTENPLRYRTGNKRDRHSQSATLDGESGWLRPVKKLRRNNSTPSPTARHLQSCETERSLNLGAEKPRMLLLRPDLHSSSGSGTPLPIAPVFPLYTTLAPPSASMAISVPFQAPTRDSYISCQGLNGTAAIQIGTLRQTLISQHHRQMPVNPALRCLGGDTQRERQLSQQQLDWLQSQRDPQVVKSLPQRPGLHTTTQPPASAVPTCSGTPQQKQEIRRPQPTGPTSPFLASGVRGPQSTTRQIPQEVLHQQSATQARGPMLLSSRGEVTHRGMPYGPSEKKSMTMPRHQTYVSSPERVVKDGGRGRLYQAVKSLPIGPAPIPPKNDKVYEFRFEVTEQQFASRPKTVGGLLPMVKHFSGALQWRVRCCKVPSSLKTPVEQQWATLDVNWPPQIFISVNHQALDVRRQLHDGKDLAVEVTDFIVCGTNVLRIVLLNSEREDARDHFIAVELLEALSRSNIVNLIWSQGQIPEEETLKTINQRLTSQADDDVFCETPDLSFDLADPFSSTIFKIPARGGACTHIECFDLETWLDTRPSEPTMKCPHGQAKCACPNTSELSSPDKWRCPICSKDASPYSLRIDGFLLKVRQQLEKDGKVQTKSTIRVGADGTWSVFSDP